MVNSENKKLQDENTPCSQISYQRKTNQKLVARSRSLVISYAVSFTPFLDAFFGFSSFLVSVVSSSS